MRLVLILQKLPPLQILLPIVNLLSIILIWIKTPKLRQLWLPRAPQHRQLRAWVINMIDYILLKIQNPGHRLKILSLSSQRLRQPPRQLRTWVMNMVPIAKPSILTFSVLANYSTNHLTECHAKCRAHFRCKIMGMYKITCPLLSQPFLIHSAFQPTTKSPSASPTPAVRFWVRHKCLPHVPHISPALYFLSAAANAESLKERRNEVTNHKPYRCTCPHPSSI